MGSTSNHQYVVESPDQYYHRVLAPLQKTTGLDFVNSLSVAEGSKVLDLGCGTGNLTVELAKRVGSKGQVVGVDPITERIQLARKHNVRDNITFLIADGETIPDDQYDLVFSNMVMHWIQDKDAVFKRVYECLCPGGRFAFTANLDTPQLVQEITNAMKPLPRNELVNKRSTLPVEVLKELATTNSFEVSCSETNTQTYPIPNIDIALQFIFNGSFVMSLADETALRKLKLKYSQQPVEFSEKFLTLVLTKTDVK